jgi:hypothetical protein
MSNSETSVDIKMDIIDNKGKINNKSETKKTSDTDYYLNLMANPNKTVPDKQELSSESELINSDSSISKRSQSEKNSSSSSSRSSSKSKKSNSSYNNKSEYVNNLPKSNEYSMPNSVPIYNSINAQLTSQEIRIKKIELLRKLSEIKTKGFSLTKEYDFNSSIDEMEYEYALLKSFVDKRNSVKVFKSGLLQTVSIIEFLNDKYDPFDFHLQGWGEHMSVEVDSYDDVLEELYEKYKGSGKKMPPEVKLLLLLTASAGAFHFAKTQTSIPGLEQTLSRNPELVSKLFTQKKQQSQFMSAQELNIQKQRDILEQRQREFKQNQQNNKSFMSAPIIPEPRQTILEPQASNESSNKINQSKSIEIKAPPNVQEILNRIKQSQATIGTTDTQDESSSNNDRIVSEVSVSETKKGRKPKTAPSIYISTK